MWKPPWCRHGFDGNGCTLYNCVELWRHFLRQLLSQLGTLPCLPFDTDRRANLLAAQLLLGVRTLELVVEE
jgi:hypothetical protein